MNIAIYYVLAVVAGVLAGALCTYLFGIIPDKWLQDYGVTPEDPKYRPSKRMRPFPEGLIAAVFCAASYCLAIFFCRADYITNFRPMHLAVILLVIPALVLVMMADKLNRIIPDQFTMYIGGCGVLAVLADNIEGSVWVRPDAPGWMVLFTNAIASLVGAGLICLSAS